MTQRIGIAAVGIGVALALTGCSGGATSATTTPAAGATTAASAAPTHTTSTVAPDRAATIGRARSIMKAYDAANNAAIEKAGAPAYDWKAWKTADTGPMLQSDVRSTKIDALLKTKPKKAGYRYTHSVDTVYGSTTSSSDGQSPWLLMTGTAKSTGSKGVSYAAAMVPADPNWHSLADIAVDRKLLPKSSAATTPTLTAAQRQAAANAVPAVVNALQLGETGKIKHAQPIKRFRTSLHKGLSGIQIDVTPRPWGSKPGTDASTAVVVGTPALRLTRVGSVTLGLLILDTNVDYDGRAADATIHVSKAVAKVDGQDTKEHDHLVQRCALELVLSIPDKGKPTVVGMNAFYLVP